MTRAQAAAASQTALLLAVLLVPGRPVQGATAAGGNQHSLVVRTTDGAVFAWGINGDGQLGDNTTTQRKTPIQVSGLSGVVAVAAGAKHSLALTSAGVLWAWGDNYSGQIGIGNNTDQKLPVQVLTGVSQIAAGDNHSIALKSDGTLWTWGANADGQLADGGTTNRNTPGQVTGLGGVFAIGAGGNHTLVVLAAGGAMKSWGKNTNGQLGDGSTYARATSPVSVSGLADVTGASAGVAFSLARRFDGSVYAWGLNTNGQLGQGDTAQRTTPTAVGGLAATAAVAGGGSHALALLSDGTLAAWGHNSYGSVGDGSGTQRTSPVAVPGLASVVAIGAGQYHSIAVTATGQVWTWGYNTSAQLGDGTTANRLSPVQIAEDGFAWKAATPTFSPAPGQFSANQNVTITSATTGATLRYTTDGTEPTESSPAYSSAIPVTVSTTLKAKAFKSGLAASNVAVGTYTLKVATPTVSPAAGTYTTPRTVSLSVTTTGATIRYTTDGTDPTESSAVYAGPIDIATTTTLKAAGFKAGWTTSDLRTATYTMNFGTLAAPGFSPAPAGYVDSVTVTITALEGATIRYTSNGSTPTLSSTLYTGPVSLTETTTLKAKAWKVDYTESPVSTATYTLTVATPLLSLAPGTYPAGTTVTVTAATAGATLHYTLDGSDPTESDAPIASGGSIVLGNYTLKVRSFKTSCDPSDVVSATYAVSGQITPGMVSAGEAFSLALLPDGTVWSWGSSANGKLGIGPASGSQYVPAPIETLTGITAVSAGDDHALALSSSGTVWSWGANTSGQLGLGTTTPANIPQPVTGLTDVVSIAAGGTFSAALKSDGTLWVWGENGGGQLGLGDSVDRLVPTLTLSGVARVSVGRDHTVVSKADGTTWTWGANGSGQLGDGTTTPRSTPVLVASLTGATHVAAGATWTFVITAGAVHAFGENGAGQLGDGTTTDRSAPVQIQTLQAAALDGGSDHSLALAPDGTVLSWGANGYGQLGDGPSAGRKTPAAIPGLSNIVSLSAARQAHSLAMAADGTIWAWGWNYYGRLGDGTATGRTSPVKIRDASLWKVGTPTMSPAGGAKTSIQTVRIDVATPGATVRYTTTGIDPIVGDPEFPSGSTLTVERSLTLKAVAVKAGLADSNLAIETYTLTVATPGVSPGGSIFYEPFAATISCSVPGAEIHYTTNGADPTPADPVIVSGAAVPIAQSLTLKAKAWKEGWNDSAVLTRTFTMVVATPTLDPPEGAYSPGQPVSVNVQTPGAELHYTTNGAEPTLGDAPVAAGASINLVTTATLKVKGWRAGWTASATAHASYIITEGTVLPPVLDPPPGGYSTPQAVAVSSGTPGAVVRCTLDGTAPHLTSPACTELISIDRTTIVSARAYRLGWTPSPVVSGAYTIANATLPAPVVCPDGGVLASGRMVRVFTNEPGATIRYTTSGLDPTEADSVIPVSGQVLIGRSLRLKARSWKAGFDPSPVAVADFQVVGAVAAGSRHVIVLKSDGTLAGWGGNGDGAVGDGTTTQRRSPVSVVGISDVAAIAAGDNHSLALRADGTVWAWGFGQHGQLGDGSAVTRVIPVQVLEADGPLAGAVAIAAGGSHSLALKADGTVWAWGYGYFGAIGDGARTQRNRAVQVPGLTGVTAIAAGDGHSLALQTDGAAVGRLWAWGSNGESQLGDGSDTDKYTPLLVADDVDYVAAGPVQSFLRRGDGLVWAAGLNDRGQLGTGTTSPVSTFSPVLAGLVALQKVAASGVHTLVLTTDGGVLATGNNNRGQLGDGSRLDRAEPATVANLEGVLDIAAAQFTPNVYVGTVVHSVALTTDGRVWTWGANYYGGLGTGEGTGDDSYLPRPIDGFSAANTDWPLGDSDGDGLTNDEEARLGTDPFDPDTNDDGISDLVAVRSGLDPLQADMDGDGVPNHLERLRGSDPLRPDTDADGVPDGADCFPLDPARNSCPEPTPGDVVPPGITLTEPTSATLIGSTP